MGAIDVHVHECREDGRQDPAGLRRVRLRLHAERALSAGATPPEVLEAMEVSAIPGGMPGLWLGADTLQEILKARGQEFK